MTNYSAKDRAFDAERAKFRRTCNDLNRRIQKEQLKQGELRDEIRELRSQIESKDEWIERLLAYTELTPTEVKNLIADEKHAAAAKQGLNSIFGANGPFAGLFSTIMQTACSAETPVKLKLPVPGTHLALVAQEATNEDEKPCVLISLENQSPDIYAVQDIAQVTPVSDSNCQVLLWENPYDESYTKKLNIAIADD